MTPTALLGMVEGLQRYTSDHPPTDFNGDGYVSFERTQQG